MRREKIFWFWMTSCTRFRSPPQEITVRLTGDLASWVPTDYDEEDQCPSKVQLLNCLAFPLDSRYPANASSVSVFPDLVQLVDKTISGPFAYGRMTLGEIQVNNFTFTAATFFYGVPTLGLGGNDLLQKTDGEILGTPFIDAIQRQQLIDVAGLGLYWDAYNVNRSQITLGAVNTAKYELPMITYTWPNASGAGELVVRKFNLFENGGSVFSVSFAYQRTVIIFDDQYLGIPKVYRNSIIAAMNAFVGQRYAYFVHCDAVEKLDVLLGFEFEGINITLTAQDLVAKVNETTCKLLVQETDDIITLGAPFLRVAYAWLDFQNNQTSLAKARQRVTEDTFVKIKKGGIVATLGEQKVIPPETEPPPTASSPPAGDSDEGRTNKQPPVAAIAGGSVGGVIALGVIGWLIFWRRKRNMSIPKLPPPPMAELEGNQRHEMDAGHGQSELIGCKQYRGELPGDYRPPAELSDQPEPIKFEAAPIADINPGSHDLSLPPNPIGNKTQ
ncbi:hypothetical protein TWF730_007823 [Orbilia blumenaviensis]|uniref:Peptidase A1 domain-containing protein n=1 Tax=Orbilia blumenaviensis TaxID=1796055 RepID=A0AAV9VBC9_9PEZI